MATLGFIYVLLPVFLAVFIVTPVRARPAVLLGISLLFYFLVRPAYLVLMLMLVLMDFFAVLVMERYDGVDRVRRGCVWFSVVKNLGMIFYMGAVVEVRSVEGVLGLLVYALSGMSMVLEAYKRAIPYEHNIVHFLLYCCFFPKLYAGPLIPYAEFGPQLAALRLRPAEMLGGFGQFVQGAVKSRVLGEQLSLLFGSLRALPAGEASVLSAWLTLLSLAFSVYFRLSGLCDMAQGLGRMFGITLPKNFYYPYQSRSVNDFFQRFNISVNLFIRRTVYAGLQEDQNGPLADALNTLVTCMLMGLWFGFRINYMVWGIYLALFAVAEKYLYPALLKNMPTLFCRVYALCVVLSSFTIYLGDSLGQTANTIVQMFSFRSLEISNAQVQYLLGSNWLLLIAACFFATNVCSLLLDLARRHAPRVTSVVMGAVDLGLLWLFTALAL